MTNKWSRFNVGKLLEGRLLKLCCDLIVPGRKPRKVNQCEHTTMMILPETFVSL